MTMHKNKIIFSSLITFSCLLSVSSAFDSEVEDEESFTYLEGSGKGPRKWGKINPHWKACENGKLQSPIDILDQRIQFFPNMGKMKRDYQPAPAFVKNRGHDILVMWKEDAGEITINGTQYKLKQCHWHSPAEHTFNGIRYKLEAHLVHENSDGNIAVVAIVYKLGRPDTFLRQLLPHIHRTGVGFLTKLVNEKFGQRPIKLSTAGKEERHVGIVNPGNIKFGSRKYYRYIGSLTVPPCTEGVIWSISKKVRTVSREQVRALRELVHDGFESNARPLQQSEGRKVWFYTPRKALGSP